MPPINTKKETPGSMVTSKEESAKKKEKAQRKEKLETIRNVIIVALTGSALVYGAATLPNRAQQAEDLKNSEAGVLAAQAIANENNQIRVEPEQSQSLTPEDSSDSYFEVKATNQTIRPGVLVEVANTGGDGLNLRSNTGVQAELITTLPEGTKLQVISVAQETTDNYRWAKVQQTAADGSIIEGYVAFDGVDDSGLEQWLTVIEIIH